MVGIVGVLNLETEVLHVLTLVEAEWELVGGLAVSSRQHVLWLVVIARHAKYCPIVTLVLLAI